MWLTPIWLVVWLITGGTTFTFGNGGAFWGLVIALAYDLFWNAYYTRPWIRRA